LSFMGLSPDPGAITLGSIINDAKSQIYLWWYIMLPVSILALITLSLQIISNGLHDAFDPKSMRVRA
jgi:ABC-type dipeptide/oligopeptide/nickel transport system permease subunit